MAPTYNDKALICYVVCLNFHLLQLVYVDLDSDKIMSTANPLASMPRKAEAKLKKSLCEIIPWYNMNENKSKTTLHASNAKEKTVNVLSQKLDFSIDTLPVSQWLTSGAIVGSLSEEKEDEASVSKTENKIVQQAQQVFLNFFTTILENYRTFFFKNKKQGIWEWDRNRFVNEWSDKPSKVESSGFLLV